MERRKPVAENTPEFSFLVQPHNIQAEEYVLGAILVFPEAILQVVDILSPECFYIGIHGDIYRAAIELYQKNHPVDINFVACHLESKGILDKIGGTDKLFQLAEPVVSSVNIDLYAKLIKERYLRRELIAACNDFRSLAYDTSIEFTTVLERVEKRIFDIHQSNTKSKGDLCHLSEVICDVYKDLESFVERKPGLCCGLYDLDNLTQGFHAGDLIIIAGRPAMGKTALALDIAYRIASMHHLPVLIYSLEMSREQLIHRFLAARTLLNGQFLRTGTLAQEHWNALSKAAFELSNLPIYISDMPSPSIGEIRAMARRICLESSSRLGLIVIDYLQLMEVELEEKQGRVQELSKLTRSLKSIARELDVPVIALSQLNRGVESRNDKRPVLSDLRDSGSIEQDADLVIMLYRDEYYNPQTIDLGVCELIVAKHRNGPTGTVKLLFDSTCNVFQNLDDSDDFDDG